MNKLIISIWLIAGITLYAQPNLEYTYPVSASICCLEKSGDKYFTMDVAGKQCKIFNLDHSIYKTINLEVPADYYLYNIQYVTENTFNLDDLVELAYIYSKYNPTESSYYYSYETRVINENGEQILKIPGAGHTDILLTENSGRKFMAYVYDFFQVPATTQTKVYSLPDQPLKSGPVRNQYRLRNPFPNPSGGMVNIPVKLPPDVDKGELILHNIHGQEVMRQVINGEEEILLLPGGTLIPGTYVYIIKSRKGESEGQKVTIH